MLHSTEFLFTDSRAKWGWRYIEVRLHPLFRRRVGLAGSDKATSWMTGIEIRFPARARMSLVSTGTGFDG